MSTSFLTPGFWSILVMMSLFVSCKPATNPEPDAVPPRLQVASQPDTIISTPESIDFSIATQNGQGPSGSLLQWNLINGIAGGRNEFTAYTYDNQRRLIGTYMNGTLYGSTTRTVGRYQNGLLAESYILFRPSDRLVGIQPDGVLYHQYDDKKRVSQILYYIQVAGKGPFKLFLRFEYEYNEAGQLSLTRSSFNRAFDNGHYITILRYWENGDCIREEVYEPNALPKTTTERLYYNQQTDPTYSLTLTPFQQKNKHFLIGSGPSASGTPTGCCQYQYTFDNQNRVSSYQMRSLVDPNPSTGWIVFGQYTYAP